MGYLSMAGKGSPWRTGEPQYREAPLAAKKVLERLQAHMRRSTVYHKLTNAQKEGWERFEDVFGDWIKARLLKLYEEAEAEDG